MSLQEFEDRFQAEQPELRPYQTGAIEKIDDAIARGVRRLMLMLPTGGGKTLIASHHDGHPEAGDLRRPEIGTGQPDL